jgi:hypothetical protein
MNTLFEHCYYQARETKKPIYLDFYEIEKKDLPHIDCYLEQTIRYNNKWYFVEMKKTYFRSETQRNNAPKYWIKNLYQKKSPILKDGTIGI